MNDKSAGTPFPTRVGLPEDVRGKLVDGLNIALASTMDLQAQVKQAHWNIKGAQFVARHQLFDELADHLRGWSDDLAERATTLGGYAEGTLRLAANKSVLEEYNLDAVDGRAHIATLIDRYGIYCNHVRQWIDGARAFNDPATEDLFVQVLRRAEMDMWFLEAHRQQEA